MNEEEKKMNIVVGIVWILSAIFVNRLYHKIFHVVYFGANGIVKELMATVIVSAFVAGFILSLFGKIFG